METGVPYQSLQEDIRNTTRKEQVKKRVENTRFPSCLLISSKVLEQTILAEANLSQLCANKPNNYQDDEPGKVGMEDRFEPEQVKLVQQQLRNAIQFVDPNNTFAIQKEVYI